MECIVCGKAINTSPDSVRCFGCASGYKSLKPTSRPIIPSDCVAKDDLRKLVDDGYELDRRKYYKMSREDILERIIQLIKRRKV